MEVRCASDPSEGTRRAIRSAAVKLTVHGFDASQHGLATASKAIGRTRLTERIETALTATASRSWGSARSGRSGNCIQGQQWVESSCQTQPKQSFMRRPLVSPGRTAGLDGRAVH